MTFIRFVLLLLTALQIVHAAEPLEAVELNRTITAVNISSNIQRLDDRIKINSPNEAFQAWASKQFDPISFSNNIHTLPSNNAQWLSFRLQSDNSELGREWVISTEDIMHLTRVTLYVPTTIDGTDSYLELADSLHTIDDKPYGTTLSSFHFQSSFDQSRPFLLKVDGMLPLKAPIILLSTQRAQWEAAVRIALSSLCVGVLFGLALYNLIIYFVVRDQAYLYYVAYSFFSALWLTQISGLLLFLNRQAGLAYYELFPPDIGCAVATLFASLFAIEYLRLLQNQRWQALIIIIVASLNLLAGFAAVITSDQMTYIVLHNIQLLLSAIISITVVIPCINLVLRKSRYALPFSIAWGILGLGIVLFSIGYRVELLGVYFIPNFNILWAMSFEMILMSYALGLKFKTVRKDNIRLQRLNITDGLTGLFNQKNLHETIEKLVQNTGDVKTLVLIDIDHFKALNDKYGHLTGDLIIKQLSTVMQNNIRRKDMAFRAGGEEFALLLDSKSQSEARMITERIRKEFSNKEILTANENVSNYTLSAGITLLQNSDDAAAFFERADKALYEAKNTGRNQVIFK